MNSSTLRNPTEEDFVKNETEDNIEQELYLKDQLSFDVETTSERIEGTLSGVKMYLKRQEEILEISQLWKSPAPALAIISLITILAILIIGGLLKFNAIGPTIPLFYDSISKQFIPTDKIFIFISGVATGILELITLRFVMLIAKTDTRLSIVMCWILFFLNILILAGIGQFYTIIV